MRRIGTKQQHQQPLVVATTTSALSMLTTRCLSTKSTIADSQLGLGATTADPPTWLIQPSDYAFHGLPFDPISHVTAFTSVEGSKLGAAFGRFDELQEYTKHLSHDRSVQTSISGNVNTHKGSSRPFFLENAKVPCDQVIGQGSSAITDMVSRVFNPANMTSATSLAGGYHDRARSFEALCRLEALLVAATEQLLSSASNTASGSNSSTCERLNAALFPETGKSGVPGEIRVQLAVVSAAKIHFLTQQQVPHLAIRQRLNVDREVSVLAARGLSLLFGCTDTPTEASNSHDSSDLPASLSFMKAPRGGGSSSSAGKTSPNATANLQRSIEQAGLDKEVLDTAIFLISQFVASTARLKEISYDEGTYEGDCCFKAGATWTVREVFEEAAQGSKEAREMSQSAGLVGTAETYSSVAQMVLGAPQLTMLASQYSLSAANEHIDALVAITVAKSLPLIASKLAVSQAILEVLRTGHLPNAQKYIQKAKMLLPHAGAAKAATAVGGGHGTDGATDNAHKLKTHMTTMGNEQQRGLHVAGGLLMALEGDLESRRSEWSYGPNKVDASVIAVYQTALEYYSLTVNVPTGDDKGTAGKTLEQREDEMAMLDLHSDQERKVYYAVRRAEKESYASSLLATGNFFLNAPRPAAKSDNIKDARVFVEPGRGMRGGPSTLTYMQSLLVGTRAGSALRWSEGKFEDPLPFDAAMKKSQQQLEKSLALTRSASTTDLEDGTNDGGDPHNLKAAYILRSLACVYSETKDYLYATGLFGSVERTFMHHYGSDSMELLDLFSLQEQYQRQIGATREGEQTFKKMRRIVDVRRGLGIL